MYVLTFPIVYQVVLNFFGSKSIWLIQDNIKSIVKSRNLV